MAVAQDELRRAIEIMQDGRVEEAAAMLRRLVDEPTLDAKGRAAASVWLAEASDEQEHKQRCLERALEYDPDNLQIRQGLDQLMEQPAQPKHLPLMRAREETPVRHEEAPLAVAVLGGQNGPASGVIVGREGLLATTSYAVGGAEDLTLRLDGGRALAGKVTRRYPQYDLAFIAAPVELARKPAIAPPALIAENAAFVALAHRGARLRGALVPTLGGKHDHWLATTIPPAQLPDAGGNPLVDERGQLLGIMTRNIGANGNALALKMAQVTALAEQFQRDRQLLPQAGYCRACGGLARALIFGGATCETCGARLAAGDGQDIQSEELRQLYGEYAAPPCRHCGARLGSHAGRCLRCGLELRLRGAG